MLDFLTIFTRGGLVLWCFDTTSNFRPLINQFINDALLQSKLLASTKYRINGVDLKYSMDNEFNLIFVVAYQNIVQLSYVDKLLTEIQLRFRDKYKNELTNESFDRSFDFQNEFDSIYSRLKKQENASAMIVTKISKGPRKWEDTAKAKKNVGSLRNDTNPSTAKNRIVKATTHNEPSSGIKRVGDKRKKKVATKWDESVDPSTLDYSNSNGQEKQTDSVTKSENGFQDEHLIQKPSDASKYNTDMIGSCIGDLKDLDADIPQANGQVIDNSFSRSETGAADQTKSSTLSSFLSSFKSVISGKPLTAETLQPALVKIQEHLLNRNVASEVCDRLIDSVKQSLIGQTLSTFESLSSRVRQAMTDIVLQILSPNKAVNVLRDALAAKQDGKCLVIVFCGVNGVGKSTSLAKIAFWLIENDLTVMIAACDTFRSGAVEQLQTHVRHLNSLHPTAVGGETTSTETVTLFQKGYGGDAASVCFNAINKARALKKDVVLVDTAGRMQDNEPLMRALTKLIHLNQPNLVLFVGEALVGNEAVDQARKFNQALSDFTAPHQIPRLIDGIVLTKFDTVDDKVGAAVSMCYTTNRPIVFVGTGQTYSDLRKLNAQAVVNALLK